MNTKQDRSNISDREIGLIEAFTRGDMAGFKYVYSLHRQKVLSYCLYYMGDRMLAEDAFQEVFARVYSRREQLREAKALKSWVLLITRSVCLNLLRESKFTPEFVSIGSTDEVESLGKTAEASIEPLDQMIADDMLRSALAKVPPMYREAFLLCEFEGHDYAAIAQMTNTTEMNVRVRITRAKKQLRQLLEPHYREEGRLKGRQSRSRVTKKSFEPDSEIEEQDDLSRGMEEVFAR
ncbi:MAG TPA: RNA polymerase sigma factor [Candidatus Kapabacteria bacterium]|jgi:RNA polymerase sigma-70 factor, ECF subfamily|nr:RNA polymerase sigma factor [Candidatus Kapabacteria bacterium]